MTRPTKIAIVGGGAAGISAALELADLADVQLFEREARLGGHALSLNVAGKNGITFPVDVGFMVCNQSQYPTLFRAFERLGEIELGRSDMSFSYWDTERGDSYVLNLGPRSPVAEHRSRLLAPHLLEIARFMRTAERDAAEQRLDWGLTLDAYLSQLRVPQAVRDLYIVPMATALWSVPEGEALAFSALRYLRFCVNHGLLSLSAQFPWLHVRGGSVRYVQAAERRLGPRVVLNRAVRAVKRSAETVELSLADGERQTFDAVVLATHGDITRSLLLDADAREAELLDAIRYQPHVAIVHRSASVMPTRREHWASWNVARHGERLRISYYLNLLQTLPRELGDVFVTLDALQNIFEADVIARIPMEHPILDVPAVQAALKIPQLQGHRRLYYAGAWLGNGFHEDAFASGVRAAHALIEQLLPEAAQ